MQGQGVAAIILLRSGPQEELTELARSDMARRRDFVEGDCIPPIIEAADAAEVFLFKDFGDEVTLSTVFGWSYVEWGPESPELRESLSMLAVAAEFCLRKPRAGGRFSTCQFR